MRKAPGMIVCLAAMLIVLGCSAADQPPPREQTLTASALSGLLQGKNPPRIIDTGSLLQWQDEHIPDSRCIPCEATEEEVKPLFEHRDTPLVLYGKGSLTRKTCALVDRVSREAKVPVFILSGGLAAWKKNGLATQTIARIPRLAVPGISPLAVKGYTGEGKPPLILDIRPIAAVKAQPFSGALNIPLAELHERYGEIPLDRRVIVVDDEGGETLLAASYLLRKGVPVVARLQGGIRDIFADKTEGEKR